MAGLYLPALAIASTAGAQQPDTAGADDIATVVVTGFRQSLRSSQIIKREADQVVDSVVAEDIGKLPDNNLAEALQRIPGVQITRNRGEGAGIAVRGLTQVKTLLNGREIYSDTGRDLSLENVPAEILGGVDVYKNPSAYLIEGGLGGVVNLKTRKPMDFEEFTASLSARANSYDILDEIKPQVSTLISNRWDVGSGEIGVLFGAAYLESASRQDASAVEPFADRYDIEDFDRDGFFPGTNADPGDLVIAPRGGGNNVDMTERERVAFNGVVQWAPSEKVELFFEGAYNKYQIDQSTYVRFANRGPLLRQPGVTFTYYPDTNVVRTGAYRDVQFTSNTTIFDREAHTWQLATGGSWQATDKLKLNADFSYTDSDRTDDSATLRIGNPLSTAGTTLTFDTSTRIPTLQLTGFDFNDVSRYQYIDSNHGLEKAGGSGQSALIDAQYEFGDGVFKSLAFGARYAARDVERHNGNRSHITGNPPGTTLPEGLAHIPYTEFFLGTGVPSLTQQFSASPSLSRDIERQCEAFGDAICYPSFNPLNSYEQSENTAGVFTQLNFGFDLGRFGVTGNVGGRYVETDLSVDGFRTSTTGVSQPISQDTSYSNFLPSFNARVGLAENVYMRLAAGRQLTRPTFGDLSPNLNLTTQTVIGLTGRAGNPDLRPLESTSYDLGFEWYFSENGYAYAAGFLKEVDGFIQTVTRVEPVSLPDYPTYSTAEITRPQNGDDGKIKGYEIGVQSFFDFLPAPWSGFGVQANYTRVNSTAPGPIAGVAVPLVGLSPHSYNALVFYERSGFRARVAYTWRDDYVETTSGPGSGSLPVYSKPFGILDASVGYSFNDNFDLSLDATNLLHSVSETYFGETIRPRFFTVYDR
ncbi:MAG TPA: TonB-dependent receptor, partial [Steroidobacteraceae bacterium]|nr:TonB-dependent receptor [Steroidobacteraceae bacterium]